MDTLELALPDPELPYRLIERLKQYGPNQQFREKDGKVKRRRPGYRDQYHVKPEGKSFYLAFAPWNSYYAPALVQIHFSQFRNLDEAMHWLKRVMGEDFNAMWTARIIRLDLCVDVSLPFDTVRGMIVQVKGRHFQHFDSTASTLYLGKQPRQTCVYQRNLDGQMVDDQIGNDIYRCQTGTRIEVRHTRDMLPIRTLADLARLIEINPFSHLRLASPDLTVLKTKDGEFPQHVKAFLYDLGKYGLHEARKRHNRSRNFSKTIGRYLGPVDTDLAECWKRRSRRFLTEVSS